MGLNRTTFSPLSFIDVDYLLFLPPRSNDALSIPIYGQLPVLTPSGILADAESEGARL
jgi:hypothetical protein